MNSHPLFSPESAAAVVQTAEEQAWLETLETTVAREIGNAGFNARRLGATLQKD